MKTTELVKIFVNEKNMDLMLKRTSYTKKLKHQFQVNQGRSVYNI